MWWSHKGRQKEQKEQMRKFEEERKRHQREERKRTKKFKDAEEARRDQILRRQRIPDADYFHLHSRCEDENGVFRRDAPDWWIFVAQSKGRLLVAVQYAELAEESDRKASQIVVRYLFRSLSTGITI